MNWINPHQIVSIDNYSGDVTWTRIKIHTTDGETHTYKSFRNETELGKCDQEFERLKTFLQQTLGVENYP
jgi:hypothetical protein